MIKAETHLFAGTPSKDFIEAGKAYIKKHGLTKNDVKLVIREDTIIVITKREVI